MAALGKHAEIWTRLNGGIGSLYTTNRPMREEQFYISWETVLNIDICEYMALYIHIKYNRVKYIA